VVSVIVSVNVVSVNAFVMVVSLMASMGDGSKNGIGNASFDSVRGGSVSS
jgi:hypothetical protein